ncbi:hypothetical protein FKM82_018096 [Ascaphus truei]
MHRRGVLSVYKPGPITQSSQPYRPAGSEYRTQDAGSQNPITNIRRHGALARPPTWDTSQNRHKPRAVIRPCEENVCPAATGKVCYVCYKEKCFLTSTRWHLREAPAHPYIALPHASHSYRRRMHPVFTLTPASPGHTGRPSFVASTGWRKGHENECFHRDFMTTLCRYCSWLVERPGLLGLLDSGGGGMV